MENFGEYLKAQREKKGIRLEEIASITKIHLHSLELLEASKWASLPPEPFLRGFIIAYAKYIGLDPKECLGKYLEIMHPTTPTSEAGSPQSETSSATSSSAPAALIESSGATPSRQIMVATAALFLLVVVGSLIYVGKRALRHSPTDIVETTATSATPERQTTAAVTVPPAPKTTPAPSSTPVAAAAVVPSKATPTPVAKVAAVVTPAPSPSSAPTAAKHQLAVEVQHKSWAKIVIDDKPPKEMILEEGEKKTFEADSKIKLVLGNASGSTVLHNGEPATGTKYDGTIRYWKFPKGARFAQDKKSARRSKESDSDDDSSSDE